MGNIVLLDELTINKIAAGEVIERPTSVVKELLENAIDAGANNISVEVNNGGIKKIRIVDNGKGIQSDDLEFAFERHATSKIRIADDLESVKTMGFRGEALASIAAIAHVELISKTENDEVGKKIVIEGGKILEKEECAAQKGTTITVSNLFFNTPVRYKFLKKDYTELGYIEDAVTRIALSHPDIAIKLVNEKKTIIQTNGNGDLKTVIYSIYGKDVSEGLLDVDYEYEDIKIKGVVGKPEIARSNRTYQIFFVNKRFIKDKTLNAGIEQAFKGLLPIGKYGVAILNIEIATNKIDVNVHPCKLEIRFQEEQKVFKAVYHSIKETLLRGDLVRQTLSIESENRVEKMEETNNLQETIETNAVEKEEKKYETIEPKENKIPSFINLFKRKEEPVKEIVKEEIEKPQNMIEDIYIEKNKSEADNIKKASEDFTKMYKKTFGISEKEKTFKDDAMSISDNLSVFDNEEVYTNIQKYKYIGALFNTYIVIELDNEIYIIDQHAAHERVLYEKVKENFYSDMSKDSQIMLLPDIINLSHKEMILVNENAGLLKKAGFIYEDFGENTVRLIGVPSICMELDTKELFMQILDELDTVAITASQEKEDKFISTIACKAAIKAKMHLNEEEVNDLMTKLLKLPNPFTCPHGRPTAIRMTKADIEKKFGRK